jgi:flagellar motor switch protein FliG
MIVDHAEDKLAVLLHLIGEKAAEKVLGQMRPDRAATLRARAAALQGQTISARRREEVLADFEHLFQFASRGRGPRLKIAEGTHSESADEVSEMAGSDWQPFDPGDDPEEDLLRLTPHQIALALETEHPRTAAIVLKHLPNAQAAAVLKALNEELKQSAIVEFSQPMTENLNLINRVLRATVHTSVRMPPAPAKQVDAVQRIAEMLRESDKAERKPLLEALQSHHPETAALVQEKLYDFTDIVSLDNRVVQRVLSEVDVATLALAAVGAEPELLEKITANLSKRARETLKDEMEFQSSARGDAVAGARKSIVQILAKIDQEGN